ncbi:MAG TPA: VOC family protein [Acidimicrobiales bacterium]
MLQRIDMVAIYARDWPSMLDWCQRQLGMTAAYVEEHHRFAVLAFPGGGPVLHLVGDDDREAGARNRCVPNIGVDDFDADVSELADRGVTVLEVVNDEDDGYRLARLADPEGNELNLYTMVSATPTP